MLRVFRRNKARKSEKCKPFRNTSVVHVPQPEGEFKDLFREMHGRSEVRRKRASYVERREMRNR